MNCVQILQGALTFTFTLTGLEKGLDPFLLLPDVG